MGLTVARLATLGAAAKICSIERRRITNAVSVAPLDRRATNRSAKDYRVAEGSSHDRTSLKRQKILATHVWWFLKLKNSAIERDTMFMRC